MDSNRLSIIFRVETDKPWIWDTPFLCGDDMIPMLFDDIHHFWDWDILIFLWVSMQMPILLVRSHFLLAKSHVLWLFNPNFSRWNHKFCSWNLHFGSSTSRVWWVNSWIFRAARPARCARRRWNADVCCRSWNGSRNPGIRRDGLSTDYGWLLYHTYHTCLYIYIYTYDYIYP